MSGSELACVGWLLEVEYWLNTLRNGSSRVIFFGETYNYTHSGIECVRIKKGYSYPESKRIGSERP